MEIFWSLRIVSRTYFVHGFSRKIFISRIIFLLEILGNICIVIVRSPGCFEIIFAFLFQVISNQAVLHAIKKSRQKFKYLENNRSFLK